MTPSLSEVVDAVLGPGGTCGDAYAGFSVRPAQVEYAHLAAGLLDKGATAGNPRVALLQGSTGVGKTLGYLVPLLAHAVRHRCRVAVATHSVDLLLSLPAQVDVAKAALRRHVDPARLAELTVAIRVARSEYVSAAAVRELIEATPDADAARLATLVGLVTHAETVGILRLWDGELPDGITRAQVVLSDAADPGADDGDDAIYQRDQLRAATARVLLCTQASVLLSAIGRSTALMPADEEPVCALVVDEADALPGMAEAVTLNYVPLRELDASLSGLRNMAEPRAALERLKNAVDQLVPQAAATAFLAGSSEGAGRKMIGDLIHEFTEVTQAALKGRKRSPVVIAIRNDLSMLNRTGGAFRGERQYGMPYVRRTAVRSYLGIGLCDPYPGQVFGRLLSNPTRQQLRHVLITSATLTPVAGEEFYRFANSLGLKEYERDVSGGVEPERYGQLRFVFSSPDVGNPHESEGEQAVVRPSWLLHLSRIISAAADAGGRTLVLVPAYTDGPLVADLLEGLGTRLVVQRQIAGDRGRCLEHFRARKDAVWISPSSWEGLDLPGLIKQLVIARLPNPGINAEVVAARRQLAIRNGRDESAATGYAYAVARSMCMRKLAQGIGRPIRSESDEATIWFADPRVGLPTELAESLLDRGLISKVTPGRGYLPVIPKRHLASLRRHGKARVMTKEGQLCQ
ncbi:hypothetical protein E4T66_17680 [Sinimarinibacterium sp. CAU 1509]|uniref:helicase C-terminal domain-containing protein n=1 Tax=Sinimarinibacterium sp. CAU 1509 TaxID=2562283 RepID=UPI0010AC8A08|nr:helicase C-terminal domain-containing protein [Sinimarinibacterium sp. CAU 1509]TJY57238.1 hypothetical protein E4T66_17680 [Sinimarinibacterium sp. CAU 1509]